MTRSSGEVPCRLLVFTSGDAPPPVVETAHGRISTLICYNLGTAGADVDLRASRDRRLDQLGHLWGDRRPDV